MSIKKKIKNSRKIKKIKSTKNIKVMINQVIVAAEILFKRDRFINENAGKYSVFE